MAKSASMRTWCSKGVQRHCRRPQDLKRTGEVHQTDSCSTEVLNASNWGNEEARSFPQKYN